MQVPRARAHVRRPQRDQLERPAAVGVAVALLVGAVEGLGDVAAERDGQLERLARVADVRLALGRQLGAGQRDDERAHRVAPLVAEREPERREDARRLGDEHRPDLELLRQRAGVQRAGAAERDEREVARVEAALDRDDPQRREHLGVDDRDHVLRRRADRRERPLGGVAVELEAARRAGRGAGRGAGSRR